MDLVDMHQCPTMRVLRIARRLLQHKNIRTEAALAVEVMVMQLQLQAQTGGRATAK